jgi:hypothetical protein
MITTFRTEPSVFSSAISAREPGQMHSEPVSPTYDNARWRGLNLVTRLGRLLAGAISTPRGDQSGWEARARGL